MKLESLDKVKNFKLIQILIENYAEIKLKNLFSKFAFDLIEIWIRLIFYIIRLFLNRISNYIFI